MTGRERLLAASRGGEVDRRPSLNEDAVIVDVFEAHPDKAVLVRVASPFSRAHLLPELKTDPTSSSLDDVVASTLDDMTSALQAGADGVFYVVEGAEPSKSTPMEYGGLYLERDRDLLTETQDAALNVVFVDGGEGAYIDFLSDLPAAIFGWDAARSGVSPAEVRAMRQGALAAEHPDADIDFSPSVIAYVRQ